MRSCRQVMGLQAGWLALLSALGFYLAQQTAEDIRRDGMSLATGLSVRGCLIFAVLTGAFALLVAASVVATYRSPGLCMRIGRVLEVGCTVAAVVTLPLSIEGHPAALAGWIAACLVSAPAAVEIWRRSAIEPQV